MGFSPKKANKMPPLDDEMKQVLYELRNPHIYIEEVDDFDNSITWRKSLHSKFEYPTNNKIFLCMMILRYQPLYL